VNVCPPKRWLSLLEISLDEVLARNFCQQYALLFRGPKQRRNRCLYLVGESQCGKSSLLAPLEGIFGRENIGIPSRDKKFSLEDLVGKRIGILDEFSRTQLSKEDFLLLAEGQPMKISMKYQKNPRMNTPPHVIFSSNTTPKYPKDDSGAVESRLSIFEFFRLTTQSIDMDAISKIREEEAAHVLVYCNTEGSKEWTTALSWYEKATENGSPDAAKYIMSLQFNAGRFYEHQKDWTTALPWYEKAAKNGHLDAMYSLANFVSGGDVPEDMERALKWLEKAADQGHCESQHSLGCLLSDDTKVTKDLELAQYWMCKAMKQGHIEAKNRSFDIFLGVCMKRAKDSKKIWKLH
jgi:tetratricopeptide (TPR) repeat protein